MNIKLNRNHFATNEISIPDGEPFDEFRSCFDGRRRVRPQGRFLILEGFEEVVRDGGETFTVYIPAGMYEMVSSGSTYSHVIIKRLGDIA